MLTAAAPGITTHVTHEETESHCSQEGRGSQAALCGIVRAPLWSGVWSSAFRPSNLFWRRHPRTAGLGSNFMLPQPTGASCGHWPADFTGRRRAPAVLWRPAISCTWVLWPVNSPHEENLSDQLVRATSGKCAVRETGEIIQEKMSSRLQGGLMSYSHAIAKSITLVTNGWLNKTGIENGSHRPCPR